MDCEDDTLIRFAEEVLRLLALYREAQSTMSNDALTNFGLQFTLVDAMAQICVLPVTTVVNSGGDK